MHIALIVQFNNWALNSTEFIKKLSWKAIFFDFKAEDQRAEEKKQIVECLMVR